MKNIFLFNCIILIGSNCFSQLEKENNKKHKLNYEKFVDQYAIDDTSFSIIDIYFDKRENSAAGRMVTLPVTAATTLVNAPIGLALMIVTAPIFVSGVITRIKYSRKNLLKTLENYQNQHILTVNLKKKVDSFFEEVGKIDRIQPQNLCEYECD